MNDVAIRPVEKPGPGQTRAASSLRALLRETTASSHQRLDRHFLGMTEAGDATFYHRFIRMNHACHATLESALAVITQRLGEPLLARREPLLAALSQDIRAMDLAPVAPAPLQLGGTDLPEAAGLVYVLDGSRLGARFIHREFIAKNLARRWPGISTAYLAGAAAPDPFGDRMDALSGRIVSESARQRAGAAAQAAFALFEAAFDDACRRTQPETAPS